MKGDTCSFCLLGEGAVERLLSGPPFVYICNRCLGHCTEIFAGGYGTVPANLVHIVCSFCGKDNRRKRVAGPTVYVCNECVEHFNATLVQQGAK